MSVQFIIGGSGSGKTEYVYRYLTREAEAHPTKNYLVLVPEQFTLQTQRKLVQLSSHKAIMNMDVLSFQRLAYRVFDDLGMADIQILEETGKNLALRRVTEEQQDRLTALRTNVGRMGYISELKSLLSELMQYRISCDKLQDFIKERELPAALSAKLSDVAVLYGAFSDFIRERYLTAEELLPTLTGVAAESALLRNSVIVFDEYTGFTPAQYELISALMPIADRMIITLTMDAREDFYRCRGEHELFAMPKETLRLITEAADRRRITVEDPVILSSAGGKRYRSGPAGWFMEEYGLRTSVNKWEGTVREISITSCQNPKEELTATARRICRLVREEGIRYQEIAVVSGDVETYGRYVPEVFERYGIPYFLDATRGILFHPFTEFIRASVDVVRRNFSYETMLRFLRCGFTELKESELDRLDNYVIATGIRGFSMWNRRWLRLPEYMEPEELAEMEGLRERIMAVLEPFYESFRDAHAKVKERLFALYQLMEALDIPHKLQERGQQYLAQGEQSKAMEYEQIYRIVMELFDRYAGIMGEERQDIREFSEILDAGLDAAQVASLPPGYDSVTVGDIERTRLNEIRVLFFVGVNDGVIPASEDQGGILSQFERRQLREADLPLAPGAREKTFIQHYYLYLNLTKPSERLYISYARVNAEGEAILPSYLIGVMERMYPELSEQKCDCIYAYPDCSTEASTAEFFLYGERREAWAAAAAYFLRNEDSGRRRWARRLLEAGKTHYAAEPIAETVARALYGPKIAGSVTRLEQFASCAYAHFLKYGLQLRERQVSGFHGVDRGNLYHDALARYGSRLEESAYSWFTIPDEERVRMSEEAFDEALAGYENITVQDTAADRYMIQRMKHILVETVWALTQQVRRGSFLPRAYEVDFYSYGVPGYAGGAQDISLRGRIDRIDTYEADGHVYIKIIDYKSGSQDFDLVRICQGRQLQLILYLNAGLEQIRQNTGRTARPAGVLYYHIDEPLIDTDEQEPEEDIRAQLLKSLRPNGLVSSQEEIYRAMDADFEKSSPVIPVTLKKDGTFTRDSHVANEEEFTALCDYVNLRIAEAGADILHGDIAVNPYRDANSDSCTYCPYTAVCGIHSKLPGYHWRYTPKADREQIFEQIRTELARREGSYGSHMDEGSTERH